MKKEEILILKAALNQIVKNSLDENSKDNSTAGIALKYINELEWFNKRRKAILFDLENDDGSIPSEIWQGIIEARSDDKCFKCPECGSHEYVNENHLGNGYRMCRDCLQDWWTDIIYDET